MYEFGFIPVSSMKVSTSKKINVLQGYCCIRTHSTVVKHGQTFLGCYNQCRYLTSLSRVARTANNSTGK